MPSKMTKWNYIAYIGHASSNLNYWGQYDELIKFIFEKFPIEKQRIETIAFPLLHLISHSLELGYKENIEYLQKYTKRRRPKWFKTWSQLFRNHRLLNLHKELKFQFDKLCKQFGVDENTIKEFDSYYKEATDLVQKLKTETETYRYAYKLDFHGRKIKRVIKHETTLDLSEVERLFNKTKILLTHTADIISYWTDYEDYINKHPQYNKGKGYLKLPKLYRAGGQYDQQFYNKLDELFERKSENLWFDKEMNEYLEVQIDGDDFYVIAIKDGK